jgi:hypothetical protein
MPSLYNLPLSQQYLDLLQTNAKMDFECRLVRGLPDGFYPAGNSFFGSDQLCYVDEMTRYSWRLYIVFLAEMNLCTATTSLFLIVLGV